MDIKVNIGGKLIDHLTFMDFSEIFRKFKMVFLQTSLCDLELKAKKQNGFLF